jgi:putative redox protein
MVPQSIRYLGGLRCEATHGPSGRIVTTDAPVDNHGKGEAHSPTDLVCTALATCMLTTAGIVAQRDGMALDGAVASVEKHMTTTLPRKIARIVVRITFPATVAVEYRAKLEKAAHTCPVALSLHPDVVQDISLTWA